MCSIFFTDEASLTLGQHPTFEGVNCKNWHTCEINYDCGRNGTCEFEYNPSFNGVYVMEDEELLFIMDKLSAISTLRMQQRYFKNIFGQKKSIFRITLIDHINFSHQILHICSLSNAFLNGELMKNANLFLKNLQIFFHIMTLLIYAWQKW